MNTSSLPPLYAAWLDDVLGGDIPSETRATCHDCAMCDTNADIRRPSANLFDPRSKCCTYLPLLPNFLVGLILADNDPGMRFGRSSVEKRLNEGLAVTPYGLEWPLKVKAQYNQMETLAFGRAQSLRCPHYLNEQGGLCGIWKYRNSVCSTWFCKYVRGSVGRQFWEAVKHLLLALELELARWCALELDLDESALQLLLASRLRPGEIPNFSLEDLEDKVDVKLQKRTWANWYGREREFFLACGELVAPLKWTEVLSICGSETRARTRLVVKHYRTLTGEEIPDRLKMGSFAVMEGKGETYQLYHPDNGLDGLGLSSRVMRLLPYFDGRPTAQIVDQVAEKEHLRFTPALLRRLVDYKILVAEE